MQRFQRILYLERRSRGSSRAVACAVGLAARHGADLTVAAPPGRGRGSELLETAAAFGVRARQVVVPGGEAGFHPELASGHDLVVAVGKARGRWPFRLSELDRALVRECGCPAWILHPAQSPEVRVVLAAVDVSMSGSEALNRMILRRARAMGVGGVARVEVVHCWSVVGESLLASRSRGGSPVGAWRVLGNAMRRRHERAKRLAEEELGGRASVLLLHDNVASGIREAAWRREADVVVVGSAGRTGLGAWLPGNTAERLIGRVPASVLVVGSAADGADAGVDSPVRSPPADSPSDSPGRELAS